VAAQAASVPAVPERRPAARDAITEDNLKE
jgi:hypothetical protein